MHTSSLATVRRRFIIVVTVFGSGRPNVVSIHIYRVIRKPTNRAIIVFRGSMNTASLSPSRLNELLVVARQQVLDILLLCETWHDADSVSVRRLRVRADGFSVV